MTSARNVRIRTRGEPAAPQEESHPTSGPLVDTFGRVHRDLRISVTDRCNLRCTYCLPEEGVTFLPRDELLTFEEITRVATVAVSLGVRSIRLSGGEPLLRRDLHRLVEMLASLGLEDLALTTNGTLLARQAPALVAAGLRRVNVSCDSLDPDRFASIRRGGDLATVLSSMDAAERAGLPPVKVNVVLVRGINDDEIERFAAFGRETERTIRFIEFMPLDASGDWGTASVVPATEIVERIAARWSIAEVPERGSTPASRFRYRDGAGEVGVIASVTQAFCGSCDRLRLTAEGALRNCLFAREEVSVRDILRTPGASVPGPGGPAPSPVSPGTELALEQALRRAVWRKRVGHGIGEPDFVRPRRSMSMIGG